MNKGFIRFIVINAVIFVLTASLYGCGSLKVKKTSPGNTLNDKKVITIRFMSNLTNREAGQGRIEQMLADKYTEEHPNVRIKFETLQDDAFQQKFKAYVSLNNVPDIYMTWTGAQFDLSSKISAELNPKDFGNYRFISGSLETRMRDGKLYGLPKNNDMYLLYYNKSIFAKNKIKIPSTFKELIAASKALKARGIIPCATNGKDKWELSGMLTEIYFRINPNPRKFQINWDNAEFEKDPFELKAAKYYKQLVDSGFFQTNYIEADYGAAKNLFTSGKAAMYYMGTWELSMATDTQLPKDFRNNLAVMQIPPIDGRHRKVNVLANWYGGGYSIYKESKVKKESIDFLKYFFRPENWAQLSWDNGVCIAPQEFKLNSKVSPMMKSVYDILAKTDVYQGKYPTMKNGGSFGTGWWDKVRDLSIGILSPEKFLKEMDKGLKKGFEEDNNKTN